MFKAIDACNESGLLCAGSAECTGCVSCAGYNDWSPEWKQHWQVLMTPERQWALTVLPREPCPQCRQPIRCNTYFSLDQLHCLYCKANLDSLLSELLQKRPRTSPAAEPSTLVSLPVPFVPSRAALQSTKPPPVSTWRSGAVRSVLNSNEQKPFSIANQSGNNSTVSIGVVQKRTEQQLSKMAKVPARVSRHTRPIVVGGSASDGNGGMSLAESSMEPPPLEDTADGADTPKPKRRRASAKATTTAGKAKGRKKKSKKKDDEAEDTGGSMTSPSAGSPLSLSSPVTSPVPPRMPSGSGGYTRPRLPPLPTAGSMSRMPPLGVATATATGSAVEHATAMHENAAVMPHDTHMTEAHVDGSAVAQSAAAQAQATRAATSDYALKRDSISLHMPLPQAMSTALREASIDAAFSENQQPLTPSASPMPSPITSSPTTTHTPSAPKARKRARASPIDTASADGALEDGLQVFENLLKTKLLLRRVLEESQVEPWTARFTDVWTKYTRCRGRVKQSASGATTIDDAVIVILYMVALDMGRAWNTTRFKELMELPKLDIDESYKKHRLMLRDEAHVVFQYPMTVLAGDYISYVVHQAFLHSCVFQDDAIELASATASVTTACVNRWKALSGSPHWIMTHFADRLRADSESRRQSKQNKQSDVKKRGGGGPGKTPKIEPLDETKLAVLEATRAVERGEGTEGGADAEDEQSRAAAQLAMLQGRGVYPEVLAAEGKKPSVLRATGSNAAWTVPATAFVAETLQDSQYKTVFEFMMKGDEGKSFLKLIEVTKKPLRSLKTVLGQYVSRNTEAKRVWRSFEPAQQGGRS